MPVKRALVFVTALLLLSACSGSASSFEPLDSGAAPSTEAPVVPTTVATTTTAAVVEVTSVTIDDGANPFGGNDAEDGLMPSVLCMNLQDAQNEIQDHGVFASGSEDATGQGRRQIIDSNWQVVGQDPEAGTPIGEFDATLFVVKYGEEPNPC